MTAVLLFSRFCILCTSDHEKVHIFELFESYHDYPSIFPYLYFLATISPHFPSKNYQKIQSIYISFFQSLFLS
eukprot:UN01233